MPRPLLTAAFAAAAAILLAPVAGAAPAVGIRGLEGVATPATLYFHLIDFQDFPINTQAPDDNYTQGTAVSPTGTLDCLPDTRPHANTQQQFHTFYGYSSPSYVEYLFEQGSSVRTHPERGISYDARIDAAQPFTVYWYVSTQAANLGTVAGAEPDSVPVPVPNLVVEARLRAGDNITVDDAGYNTGPTIAAGRSRPATLLADQALDASGQPAPDVTPLGQQPDGRWLFEVAVPMAVEQAVIPRDTGYNLRVDVYLDSPACTDPTGEGMLTPNLVEMHTSPGHRPRMELAVFEAIRLEYIHPQFVGDELVIHTAMNSVWGNYDVAEVSSYTPAVTPDDLQVSVEGPTPADGLALAAFVMETHGHYQHQEAVAVTYLWPYKADRAKDGLYTVTVSLRNDQRTAEVTGTAQFEIGKDARVCSVGQGPDEGCESIGGRGGEAGNAVPGPGLLAALAGAGLAAGLRRRRA